MRGVLPTASVMTAILVPPLLILVVFFVVPLAYLLFALMAR